MHDRILLVASQEMNEHGLKFTMDDVAVRLGISKKTLYQYFPSKDMLISSVIEAYLADIERQHREVIARDGEFESLLKEAILLKPQRVVEVSPRFREELIKQRPADWAKVEAFCNGRAQELILCLEEAKESGHVRPIHAKVAACMLTSMAEGLFQKDFLEENNLTFSDAFEEAIDIFFYGIIAKKDKA